MIEFKFDETEGIIRVTGSGRWTLADVDAHFVKFAGLLANLRTIGRPIKILSDVTQAEVQHPDIEARINAHSARLYRPGDRVALIVKTNIVKQHVRGTAGRRDVELFCSAAAAEMWLTAYDLRKSA